MYKMVVLETFLNLISVFSSCILVQHNLLYDKRIYFQDGVKALGCMSLENYYNLDSTPDVQVLVVLRSNGNLKPLKQNSFSKITELREVYIHNSINEIEVGAFDGIQQKKIEIHFQHNKLPVLKANTFNLSGNVRLSLYDNNIEDIEPRTFGNVDSIELQSNKIKTIKTGIFSNLDTIELNLRNNRINKIEDGAFYGMRKLKYLNLESNKLNHFDLIKLFGELTNLQMLYLSDNSLIKIENNMFTLAPNLLCLGLSKMSITEIPKNVFQNLKSLEFLDLENNTLNHLSSEIFPEKNKLTYLFLNDNKITDMTTKLLEKISHVKKISLYDNPLQCISDNTSDTCVGTKYVEVICNHDAMCFDNQDICDQYVTSSMRIIDRLMTCKMSRYDKYMLHLEYKDRIYNKK